MHVTVTVTGIVCATAVCWCVVQVVGAVDALCSFAAVASSCDYVRPKLCTGDSASDDEPTPASAVGGANGA